MTGRVVWITGASSGIGEALARACADAGASVVLSARRADALQQIAAELPSPERHMILPLDVTDMPSHEAAFAAVLARYGHLDTLVCNAGIGQRASIRETDLETERRIMEVNFFGAVSLVRVTLEHLITRPDGHIVATSSVMGRLSTPRRATYAASKHAMNGWFDGLRAELHGTPVAVTLLCPGYIRTEISHGALTAYGSAHGAMDEQHRNAMTAEAFARKAVRALKRRRAEVYIGGPEIHGVLLQRFVPGLVRWLLPRVITRD